MNPIRPFTAFLSPAANALLAVLGLAALACGQQKVCMSLHAGPATGTNSLGAPAQVAGRANGVQVSVPTAAGQTAAQASTAHENAFRAAGFTTERVNPTLFCVTLGPGGAPITSGLCYGTDDMGLDLDSSVSTIPAAPAPAADPATKPGGAVVPLPPVNQPPMPFSGQIVICFDVIVFGVKIRICVTVQIMPNLNGQQLGASIEQQLLQQGFRGNRIRTFDPLHAGQAIDVLQVDSMTNGDVVVGVEYQYDAMSRRVLRQCTGAGVLPLFGACEYGVPSQGSAPRLPWSHCDQPPRINSFFDVFHEVGLPNQPGGIIINLQPASMPLLNGVLLVEPNGLAFEFGITDGNGTLHRRWSVPNNAGLIGLPIYEQGGATDSNGALSMTTGIRAVIGS
jgi:hypothetical protein